MPDESIANLVHAVGAAAENRVPLDVTLAALAEERVDPAVSRAAQRLSSELQSGATIEQALAKVGADLPPEIRGLLHAGVESGDLAGTIERFAEQRLAAQKARMRVRAAIAYPLVILAILIPILLFLSLFVVPMFGQMFEEFDLNLPVLTSTLLTVSQQLPMFLGGTLLLVIGIPLVLRILGGRWVLHRVRSATPLFGRLWMWSGQREFAATFGSFLALRLPVTSAVSHTAEVLSDRNMARACRRLAERLGSGQSLSDAMSQSIHFDRTLVALAAWGERNQLLPEAIRIAVEVFDDRVDQYSSLMRRILPPLTLIGVAMLMFFVILGLMLPMVKLIEGLAG